MITPQQFEKLLNYNPSEQSSPEELQEYLSIAYLLDSFNSKKLEKLKALALKGNIEFTNSEFNTQGYVGVGNATNQVDKAKLIDFIGIDSYVEISSITESAVKEKFGDKSRELNVFKENVTKVPSTKKIYKIEVLKG
jgi:hypothetical protein